MENKIYLMFTSDYALETIFEDGMKSFEEEIEERGEEEISNEYYAQVQLKVYESNSDTKATLVDALNDCVTYGNYAFLSEDEYNRLHELFGDE